MTTNLFERQEWLQAADNLRRKGHEFTNLYNELSACDCSNCAKAQLGCANCSGCLKKEHDSLMQKGALIKGQVSNIMGSVDNMHRASNMLFGTQVTDEVSNLGFIPLIPIALIAAGTGAVSYWVKDAWKHKKKVEEVKRLEAEGYTPEQAYAMVNKRDNWFSNPIVLISGAALLLLLFRKR